MRRGRCPLTRRPRADARAPRSATQAAREQLTQLLFEQFNVAGLFCAEAPVLSLYAAGKLTGTVVDVGAGKIGASRRRPRAGAHSRG